MMTKNISKFLLLSVIIFFFGCGDDFLDRQPLDQRAESNFYQSQSDAEEALVAMYDAVGWNTVVGFHPIQLVADVLSDDSFAGGASRNDVPVYVNMDKHQSLTTGGEIHGLWRKYYTGIYRANLYLEKIEGIAEIDPAFKTRTIAEAKFLRAYYYSDLLKLFERVPLLTETLKAPSEYAQPQAEPEAIIAQIAQDLVDAIADLPTEVSMAEAGRVTKWAAQGILARTYLFVNGVYGTEMSATVNQQYVLNQLEDMIANSGHDLMANYGDNFLRSSEFGIESVFEISYSDAFPWFDWGFIQGGEGNMAAQMQGPRLQDPGIELYEAGWSFGPVTQELYDAFEDGDPRRAITILEETELNGGLNIGYQHTGFFNQKYTTSKEYMGDGQLELNWGNNLRVVRFSDVLLMAAELGSPNAQDYLDRVRARVGLPSVPVSQEAIRQERRVELALEGVRYHDLIRYGLDVADEAINTDGARGPGYIGDDIDFASRFNTARRGLFPIPQTEIDISNGLYTQNAGY
ncbi:MAG: RagB/SusD family nutrient uptake outer membrane protein [Bacteroidota bacterium]